MAQSVRTRFPSPRFAWRALLHEHTESWVLVAILALALLARLVNLGTLEPNVLPDEADHLTILYRILAGRGPGPTQLSWDGNPAASLYPALPFLKLFGPSYVALRLSTAFASLLALVVFFLLARRSLGAFASLGATTLLAFSSWYLFFSRNGEVNVWVLLLTVAAAYSTEVALGRKEWQPWLWAGAFCGLGWYTYLGGVFILPILLLYLAIVGLLDRQLRARALWGGLTLVGMTALLLLPRVPNLLADQRAIATYVGGRAELGGVPLSAAPGVLANQLLVSFRAFVLMDAGLPGNSRYIAPGAPVFDSLTGTLYVAGLFLSLSRPRQTALWWCLFAPLIFVVQPLTRSIPDGARALAALPAMMLFAGLAIDWLVRRRLGELAALALALAIPVAAYWNWAHYAAWQRSPANAANRQPAVEVVEFPRWQESQMARAAAGQPGFNVMEWHQMREQARPTGPATSSQPPPGAASSVAARPIEGFQPGDLAQPRGLAADERGVFIAEPGGRVLRLDPDRGAAAPGTSGGPPLDAAADLAVGPDGSLYVLDGDQGRIDRYDPSGRFAESLGTSWGMYHPRGLTVGPDGRLYVADTGRDRVVIAQGIRLETELPDLDQPTDVAVDERGAIYVAEPEASRLAMLDWAGQRLASWPIGHANTIESPHLALLEAGVLAVTEPEQRRVVFLSLSGQEIGQIGDPDDTAFGLPYGLAVRGDRLYVTDLERSTVRAFELEAR